MLLPESIPPELVVARPPSAHHPAISPWLDEQIWGHRIYTQSPWLIFLEFLTVAEACHREARLLDEGGEFYPLMFRPYKRLDLRNILWNNDAMARIDEANPDSHTAWEVWLEWMADKARGVNSHDFSYLKPRFRTFHEFTSLVAMLRGAAVESQSNKRWTSRFIFPFGPAALYEDLNLTAGGAPTREYINFGRTGELLYLMLCRCAAAAMLKPHLARLMEGKNQWNVLLSLLQRGPETDTSERGKSYLPYRSHACFDALGEDWLSVFRLDLPNFDAVTHLVTLGALHLMLYQLQIAAQWSHKESKVYFLCEVVAPKKTLVRELSTLNYQENNVLTAQAVQAYIDEIEKSEDWQRSVSEASNVHEAFTNCRGFLVSEVWWGDDDDYSGVPDPAKLLDELQETALRRHQQYVADIHRIYGREAGLVSRRGTNKFRYAPNDSLLKTLLLANVPKRMELHEFLHLLFERYGFVFNEHEAARVVSKEDFDPKPFAANAARLEQRLGSLGLLRRLSDGCAYVLNPHSQGKT
ncbi:MAG: hypothetical protein JOZ57_06485 [Abitibacteriaceae bacterium]|nr:hypothetical protein [Abditibacteriaceae bacterium]